MHSKCEEVDSSFGFIGIWGRKGGMFALRKCFWIQHKGAKREHSVYLPTDPPGRHVFICGLYSSHGYRGREEACFFLMLLYCTYYEGQSRCRSWRAGFAGGVFCEFLMIEWRWNEKLVFVNAGSLMRNVKCNGVCCAVTSGCEGLGWCICMSCS